MNRRGASLLEVTAGTAIAGTLLAFSFFSFQDWVGKYRVEKAASELYSDMMEARVLAMEKNREHYIEFTDGGSSYTMYDDKNENGIIDPGEALPQYPRTTDYPLNCNGAGSAKKFRFDSKGMISPLRTVWIKSSADPDIDCMRISDTRIALGKTKYDSHGNLNECQLK